MDDKTDKPDGPSLVEFKNPPNEMAAAVDNATRNLPFLIEGQTNLAKIRRAAYLAYIKEGFTEAQALELCAK